MRWYRRRSRLDLGTYEPPASEPIPAIADLVEEAVLIAGAGVRMSVKNLIILKSLRDRADYSAQRYRRAVQEELINLAHEKETDADRIAAVHATAQARSGRPAHQADYRSIDATALERREQVSRRLAERLRELSDDEEFVHGLVEAAHETAWHEIAGSIEAAAARGITHPEPDYARHRHERLLGLLGDLAELAAEADAR